MRQCRPELAGEHANFLSISSHIKSETAAASSS